MDSTALGVGLACDSKAWREALRKVHEYVGKHAFVLLWVHLDQHSNTRAMTWVWATVVRRPVTRYNWERMAGLACPRSRCVADCSHGERLAALAACVHGTAPRNAGLITRHAVLRHRANSTRRVSMGACT